jgi:hypothetical protein
MVIPWNISYDVPAIQYKFIDLLTVIIRVVVKTAGRLFNPLNAGLNPICHLLALLGAHPILHVSRIKDI